MWKSVFWILRMNDILCGKITLTAIKEYLQHGKPPEINLTEWAEVSEICLWGNAGI